MSSNTESGDVSAAVAAIRAEIDRHRSKIARLEQALALLVDDAPAEPASPAKARRASKAQAPAKGCSPGPREA